MQVKKTIMKILFSTVLLTLLSLSSFSQWKTNFTKQNYSKFFKEDCIPKDLKSDGLILIVRSPFKEKEEKKNAEIKEIFDSLYKGKFIVQPTGVAGNYADTKIYKYTVSILPTMQSDNNGDGPQVNHLHYKLDIIDNAKLLKGKDPQAIKDQLQGDGKKKIKVKDINLGDFDLTAIKDTGLEDSHSKLMDMLAFLASKLGAAL
jgi:hypothetical protein